MDRFIQFTTIIQEIIIVKLLMSNLLCELRDQNSYCWLFPSPHTKNCYSDIYRKIHFTVEIV